MVILLYSDEENLVNSEIESSKKISDVESFYNAFDELKLMLGYDDLILLHESLIDIFNYFPFDKYFVVGAPIGIAPSTFVNTSKERTIKWSDLINYKNLEKKNANITNTEEDSNYDD